MTKQVQAAAPIAPVATLSAARNIALQGACALVNPKKPGSASHARFALYATHKTVEQYIAACVAGGQKRRNATADIAWDVKHGYIAVA